MRALTFLMTDVEGSTRLWENLPELMPEIVRRHEELLVQAVHGNGGRLIKSKGEGDSTFNIFESATGAVRAALAAQRALSEENWPNEVKLKVRMGIHLGEVQSRDDDFFGPAINRCARIREVGHGGQILVSGPVHDLAFAAIEGRWTDFGVHRLRDLLRPEQIWQVQDPWSDAKFPKLKSLSVLQNNLPVQLTSFIGRRPEIDKIKRLIHEHRLVNVIGFGGQGKTRLVLQVGAELDAEASAGVWFVALDSLRTAKEVTTAIVAALGGDLETEITPESIGKLGLKSGDRLLILDNAEHLTRHVRPIVDLLLREAPPMRILVSSREPLHQEGEVLCRISGLSLPPATDESIEALERSESGELFLNRAKARSSEFRLTAGHAKSIGAICRLLDGVPLALEQAATLVAIMSPSQVLEKLQTRIDWLASEDPGMPTRHRSLSATIQWSYELLTEEQRTLFLMSSLFRSSFTMEASGYLAGLFVEEETQAVSLMRHLVDASLVTMLYDSDDEVRLSLLETLRHFAQPLLTEAAELWMSRYVDWYVAFTRSADAEFVGPNQIAWLEKCEAEQANLRKALEWCQVRSDPRLLWLAYNFRKFWIRKGLYSEGRRWLEVAYAMASSSDEPTLPAIANILGSFVYLQGDFPAALDIYKTALSLYEAAGDQQSLPAIYTNIAITLDDLGKLEESSDYYFRAIQSCEAVGNDAVLSMALLNHSISERFLGHFASAEKSAFQALALAETMEDPGQVAQIHLSLCAINIEQSKFPEAAHHARSALKTTSKWNPDHFASLLLHVSKFAVRVGDLETAVVLVGGAEVMLEAAGAQRESRRLEIRKEILATVSVEESPSQIHAWKTNGRRTSQDQLILRAREICELFP